MAVRSWRRLVAFLAVMALIVGLAAHGIQAAHMDAEMMASAAMSDLSPSGNCSGCAGGDDNAMSPAACLAFCGGAVAVLPDADSAGAVAIESAPPLPARATIGRTSPPDPHPPKSAVLS